MPSRKPDGSRDYQKENKRKSEPLAIANRVARNKAREHAIASGRARRGDGTIVHHKKNNPRKHNNPKDVVVVSRDAHNKIHTTKHKAKR